MSRRPLAAFTFALAFACACGDPPKVVQGTVVSYRADDKSVVVLDSVPPNAEMTLSLQGADVGADPAPKDVVRIAYREQQGKLVALRLMNVTRQKEMKSGGH